MCVCVCVCVCVQVEESAVFERDGFDLHSEVHVSFTQAILGGEVKTTGLSGPIVVKVWHTLVYFGQQWSLFGPHRFQLVSHRITGYGWQTGESPDSITMATAIITSMSRSILHGV